MRVSEIFTSIQGESSYAGLPCTFVRLAGCNMRCGYCDTRYAYEGGTEMSREDIAGRVRSGGVTLVEITGGEPLMQEETPLLIRSLLDDGFRVLLETNGSFSIGDIDERAVIILDVKTPGSGMSTQTDFSNFERLKPTDEVKFVLCGREDYEWAGKMVSDLRLDRRCVALFSPVAETLDPALLWKWIVEDKLQVRFNIQLHKCVFGEDARGV